MKSILIRAEDKNKWERRTAIVPADLSAIVSTHSIKAFVESSDKRIFAMDDYTTAGAHQTNTASGCDIIFGLKEIPVDKITQGKVHVFFSHTIKGQIENMPVLQKIMATNSTLIDYEKIVNKDNRRLVYFGNFAGVAGALDILWLMGQRWAAQGILTPLSEIQQAFCYKSVADAKAHLSKVGKRIAEEDLPEQITPLVIAILGYGNVSRGAQDIFKCLPTETITPEELTSLTDSGKVDTHKVYLTIFDEEHLVSRKDGGTFELADYFTHPQNYQSRFSPYLPYISILVNAVYWTSKCPKFVTWDALNSLNNGKTPPKLAGIADITCDTNGSIECNIKATDSGTPAYIVNPLTRKHIDGIAGDGVLLLAVDNLPAEVANDSSIFFSRQLKPYVANIAQADYSAPLSKSGLAPEIQKAIIVYNGNLTDNFQYLKKYLE